LSRFRVPVGANNAAYAPEFLELDPPVPPVPPVPSGSRLCSARRGENATTIRVSKPQLLELPRRARPSQQLAIDDVRLKHD
jgi:hypothetical protein